MTATLDTITEEQMKDVSGTYFRYWPKPKLDYNEYLETTGGLTRVYDCVEEREYIGYHLSIYHHFHGAIIISREMSVESLISHPNTLQLWGTSIQRNKVLNDLKPFIKKLGIKFEEITGEEYNKHT